MIRMSDVLIMFLIFVMVVCFIIDAINDKIEENKFRKNIKVRTKLYLIYFNFKDNSVQKIFKSEVVKFIDKNQVVIKYSDGSTETNYITGFGSLYSKGWRIEK